MIIEKIKYGPKSLKIKSKIGNFRIFSTNSARIFVLFNLLENLYLRYVNSYPSYCTWYLQERAVANGLLATVNGEFLDRIAATDEDGLHAGTVTFSVVGNSKPNGITFIFKLD